MLSARKSPWFERVFAAYNRNLLCRRFEGVRVAGLEHLRARAHDAPLVLYANHSSWWDGLVVFQLSRVAGLEQYAMMEEKQLREYPFHRRLGAFSVVRGDRRAALRSLEYAGELLRGTERALWIFPQGETLPNDTRPLRLYSGAARVVARVGACYAAPVAFRYEFLEDFRPHVFARIGALESFHVGQMFNAKAVTRDFTTHLTDTLDQVRADILHARFDDYKEIVAPPRRAAARRHVCW